jgi:hypothetical protein
MIPPSAFIDERLYNPRICKSGKILRTLNGSTNHYYHLLRAHLLFDRRFHLPGPPHALYFTTRMQILRAVIPGRSDCHMTLQNAATAFSDPTRRRGGCKWVN